MSLIAKYIPEKAKQHAEDYLREFVYGGIDGVITTYAVVAAAAGAKLGAAVVLILGFANLIADGISMGVGSYLSTKSERELLEKNGESTVGEPSPAINGVTTYFAFVIFGLVPIIAYTIEEIFDFIHFDNTFFIASVMTGIAFVVIGWLKSKVAKTSIPRSVAETLVLGVIAATFAYAIGHFVEGLIS